MSSAQSIGRIEDSTSDMADLDSREREAERIHRAALHGMVGRRPP
ncbi:hypothetical protein PUR23_19855 [Methylorubrum populi]